MRAKGAINEDKLVTFSADTANNVTVSARNFIIGKVLQMVAFYARTACGRRLRTKRGLGLSELLDVKRKTAGMQIRALAGDGVAARGLATVVLRDVVGETLRVPAPDCISTVKCWASW